MGLDVSCVNVGFRAGSYSGFNAFRRKLAKCFGLELEEMQGFGGKKDWKRVDKGIAVLLNHSDCEGTITPAKAQKLLTALLKYKDEEVERRKTNFYALLHEDPEERQWFAAKIDSWIEICEESVNEQAPIRFH